MTNGWNENMDALLHVMTAKPDTAAILLSLFTALALSAVLWLTYRFSNTRAEYRPVFGVTLVMLAFLSTVLMDLIQSNLALSLGMLGSLSIVRFRTNIKDTRDIGFIFWSMAVGIAAATHSYFIGIIGSLVMAGFMLATRKRENGLQPMMLVIRGSSADIRKIQEIVDRLPGLHTVKAKNVLCDSFELVYEVRISLKESDDIIGEIFDLGGIDSVNLLAPSTPELQAA